MRIKKTENGWIVYAPVYLVPIDSKITEDELTQIGDGSFAFKDWGVEIIEREYCFIEKSDVLNFIENRL